MNPLQYFRILRAADNYALVATRVHAAKAKAKLTGDSLHRLDRQRDAARARLIAVLDEQLDKPRENSP